MGAPSFGSMYGSIYLANWPNLHPGEASQCSPIARPQLGQHRVLEEGVVPLPREVPPQLSIPKQGAITTQAQEDHHL